jgi:hypothetical protein
VLGLDETREGGGNICEVRDAWQMNRPGDDPATSQSPKAKSSTLWLFNIAMENHHF